MPETENSSGLVQGTLDMLILEAVRDVGWETRVATIGQDLRFAARTYAVVGVAFAGVVLLASYVPARRATEVDPLEAIRYE